MSAGDDRTPAPSSAPCFETTPYRAEGGFTPNGLTMCVLTLLVTAAILAYPLSFVDAWIPDIEWVLAIGVGFVMAGVGWPTVGWAKLRNTTVALLAGCFAGATAFLAIHYANYERTREHLADDVKRLLPVQVLPANVDPMHQRIQRQLERALFPDKAKNRPAVPAKIAAEVGPILVQQFQAGKLPPLPWAEIAANPDLPAPDLGQEVNGAIAEAVEDFGFCDYLDWKATQGAKLALPKVHKSINVGYTGSYILWSVEALIASLIAGGFLFARAKKPFCPMCETWKLERDFGRLDLPAELAQRIFDIGAIVELAGQDRASRTGPLRVLVAVCSNCAAQSEVDVKLAQVTKDAKGRESTSVLTHRTYPGPALRVLEAIFAPPEAPATPDDEDA